MFASKSLAEHLLRGALGAASAALALSLAPTHPWLSLGVLPVAVIALRGCPMCWTLGLLETVAATIRGAPARPACRDGSCALARSADVSSPDPG